MALTKTITNAANHKTKLFVQKASNNSNLGESGIYLPAFFVELV